MNTDNNSAEIENSMVN